MKKIITGTLLIYTLAIAGGDITPVEPAVEAPVVTSEWESSVSIYGWLPSFDGSLNYTIPGDGDGDGGGDVEIDWLDKLDIFFMANYEVRKGKWSFLTDMIYVEMSDSYETSIIGSRIPVAAESELTGWLLSFYGGYCTVDTDTVTLDMIAGLRYLSLDLDVDGTFGRIPFSTSPSAEFYDAVIGFKGKVNLNEKWYVPYLFDIGGGDSDLTWQASASIGYRFDWGDALLTYRYIHYDNGDTRLVRDLDIYGPKVGVVFHF